MLAPDSRDRGNSTHMTRARSHGEIRNPLGAIENAKALLRVASHLDADTDKEPTETLLFHGLIIVVPTLLGLAAELALKALYMREEGTSPKSHDLLDLFDRLPAGLKRRLEQKMPGAPSVHPDLPSVFPSIREVLAANRTLFVEWRYLHERHRAMAETSVLKEAISTIIETFEESTLSAEPNCGLLRDR